MMVLRPILAGRTSGGERVLQVLRIEEPANVHARWMLQRASRRLEASRGSGVRVPGADDEEPVRARIKEEVN
jgi:hypothetical protein